jgi:predicted DNA-binding transcriptional regulator AlpA
MKHHSEVKTSSTEVTPGFGSITLSPGEKFIRLPEVLAMTAMKKSTLYQAISECTFMSPIKQGKCSVWLYSEVLAWMQQRVDASRSAAQGNNQLSKAHQQQVEAFPPVVKVGETSPKASKAQASRCAVRAANQLSMAGQLGLKEAA